MYLPEPYHEDWLPTVDGHAVYYAEYGNAGGPTIVSIHGGPGSRSKAKHATLFDLSQHRVVLFDQRGCGQSTPAGAIEHNTTDAIIYDLERLRTELQVERWFVAGSSWGSAVALTYAERHPAVVAGLLLSAVFLADVHANDWAFNTEDGARAMFPDGVEEWQRQLKDLGADHLGSTEQLDRLYELATQGTVPERAAVAAIMQNWEANLLSRNIPTQFVTSEEVSEADIASAAIFLHFQHHRYFLEAGEILRKSSVLSAVPTIIVHGRYDILCPPRGAAQLAAALPQADLVWLPETHHKIDGDGAVARVYAFRYFLERIATQQ